MTVPTQPITIESLLAAIRAHHTLRYGSSSNAKPVFAPPDVGLYTAAGIAWHRPAEWHPRPEQLERFRRDSGAAARERALIDGASADPVRVDSTPEQMAGA